MSLMRRDRLKKKTTRAGGVPDAAVVAAES
jgi:hypothetical protein